MNLALRDLAFHRGRFLQTCVGLGLLLGVVMSMGGIYRGLVADALAVLDGVGADLWVVQEGSAGPFAATSRLPEETKHRIRAVPGVAAASPLVFQNLQLDRDGRPLRLFLVGFEPGGLGGPPQIVAGRPIAQKRRELVADRSLGLAVGEALRIAGEEYAVVGLTRGMVSSGGDPVAYVTLADAQRIQFREGDDAVRLRRAATGDRVAAAGIADPRQARQAEALLAAALDSTRVVNAVVARLAPGEDPREVAGRIARWKHLGALTDAQQRFILTEGVIKKARMQLGLFRTILLAISAVIVSLIVYTGTLDKLRTIATLKLIGARNRVIAGLILQQSLAMGVAAYAIGYVLIAAAAPRFPRRVELVAADLRALFVVVVAICVLASLAGIRRALRVEAAQALGGQGA